MHITVKPSRDWWLQQPGNTPVNGFWGTVHIYPYSNAEQDAITNGAAIPARYSMWAPGQERLPVQLLMSSQALSNMCYQATSAIRTYNGDTPSRTWPTLNPPPLNQQQGKIIASVKTLANRVLGGEQPTIATVTDNQNNKTWAIDPDFVCPGPITVPRMSPQTAAQYEVDVILDCALLTPEMLGPRGLPVPNPEGVYYRVRWSGWPYDNAWYPAKDFRNCPAKLREYHNRNPGVLMPASLWNQEWDKAYLRDRVRTDDRWVSADMIPASVARARALSAARAFSAARIAAMMMGR